MLLTDLNPIDVDHRAGIIGPGTGAAIVEGIAEGSDQDVMAGLP